MLQSITVRDFKSFKAATLKLSELTVLIGANASGKSNLIEAIQLLSWIARGRRLGDLVPAIKERDLAVRGTVRDLTYEEAGQFGYDCIISDGLEPSIKLTLNLAVGDLGMRVVDEKLWPTLSETARPMYQVEVPAGQSGNELQVSYNDFAKGNDKPRITCIDQQAVFTQLTTPARFGSTHLQSQNIIPQSAELVRQTLESILFLDPVPGKMRDYSDIGDRLLQRDGSNVSAVLYGLSQDASKEEQILDFVRSLPEQDIKDIDFLTGPRGELMVKLVETFGGHERPTEAALLSDGTLRVLAVAAALLSVPEGSTVVIEEIDNGVHPSRAEILLGNIQKVAAKRKLRVVLTTHNPALLDAIPIAAIPHVVACYRDPEEGDSRLVRLQDLESYPELVAQGPVGRLVTQGILDRFLKNPPTLAQKMESTQQLLDLLRQPLGDP